MHTGFTNKLIFIKDIYKDKQGVSDIKYFESVKKALPFIMENSTLATNRISIVDLIQIYECDKVQYVPKVLFLSSRSRQSIKNTQSWEEDRNRSPMQIIWFLMKKSQDQKSRIK